MARSGWEILIRYYDIVTSHHDAVKGLQSGLSVSVPFQANFGSKSVRYFGRTYSKEIRINTWISPAIVCLLKDQVKSIIKLFFEICTVNRLISTKHLVVLSGESPDYACRD